MDKFSALKYYYGYDTFKEGQAEVIDQLLAGWRVRGDQPVDFADEGSGEHVAANGYFCCLYQQFPFFTGIP